VSKAKNLLGKKYGKWSVLKKVEPLESFDKRRQKTRYTQQWECQCQCGLKRIVIQDHLLSGKSSQCRKCKAKERKLNGKISSVFYAHIKHSAKLRKIEFDKDIDRDYLQSIYEKQNKKCGISGLPIVFANSIEEHKNGYTTASLDRIDSSKGYTKSNIQWVHKDINKMKSDFSMLRFVELCYAVLNGKLLSENGK